MGIRASEVRRQLHPVAPERTGLSHRLLDQQPPDAAPARLGGHVHRLKLGADAATPLEVLDDDQLEDTEDGAVVHGNEDLRGPSPEGADDRGIRRRILGILGSRVERAGVKDLDDASGISGLCLPDHQSAEIH